MPRWCCRLPPVQGAAASPRADAAASAGPGARPAGVPAGRARRPDAATPPGQGSAPIERGACAAARIGAVDVLMLTNVLPGGRRTGGEIVTQSVVDALFKARRFHPGATSGLATGAPAPGSCAWADALGRDSRAACPRRALALAPAGHAHPVLRLSNGASRAYSARGRRGPGERPGAVIVDHAGLHVVAPPADRSGAQSVFLAHNAEGEMYAVAPGGGVDSGQPRVARNL